MDGGIWRGDDREMAGRLHLPDAGLGVDKAEHLAADEVAHRLDVARRVAGDGRHHREVRHERRVGIIRRRLVVCNAVRVAFHLVAEAIPARHDAVVSFAVHLPRGKEGR